MSGEKEVWQLQMDLDAIDAAKPAKQEVIEQFFVDPDRSFSAIVVIEPAAADRTGDRFDPNYHTVSGTIYGLEVS